MFLLTRNTLQTLPTHKKAHDRLVIYRRKTKQTATLSNYIRHAANHLWSLQFYTLNRFTFTTTVCHGYHYCHKINLTQLPCGQKIVQYQIVIFYFVFATDLIFKFDHFSPVTDSEQRRSPGQFCCCCCCCIYSAASSAGANITDIQPPDQCQRSVNTS